MIINSSNIRLIRMNIKTLQQCRTCGKNKNISFSNGQKHHAPKRKARDQNFQLRIILQGTILNTWQNLRYTRKSIYSSIFTNNTQSNFLRSPVNSSTDTTSPVSCQLLLLVRCIFGSRASFPCSGTAVHHRYCWGFSSACYFLAGSVSGASCPVPWRSWQCTTSGKPCRTTRQCVLKRQQY